MREGKVVKFRSVKPEIRVLGVDDGVFVPHTKGLVDIVGVVYRGGRWLDGVMRTEVEIDGMDATEKIASMISSSPHYDQLRVVILNGITFAGFNVVNIKKLFMRLGLPVIAITRKKPNLEEIKTALKNLTGFPVRWEAIQDAGEITKVFTRRGEGAIYIQLAGIVKQDANKILRKTSTRSDVPEALRVAHIIASGLARMKRRNE